jgi:hypothetical protein
MADRWMHEAPRDFFNYATLMRCLGKLSVAIHDEMTNGVKLTQEVDQDNPFQVEFDQYANCLSVKNYSVYWHKRSERVRLDLWTPYNSEARYPLFTTVGGEELKVLDKDGKFALVPSDFASIVLLSPQEKLTIAAQTFSAVELTLRELGSVSMDVIIKDLSDRVNGFKDLGSENATYLTQEVLALLSENGTIDLKQATTWGDENTYNLGLKDFDMAQAFSLPSQIMLGVEQVLRRLGQSTFSEITADLEFPGNPFTPMLLNDDFRQQMVEAVLAVLESLKLVDRNLGGEVDDAWIWKLTF